jgi:hypothetical protein
MWGTGRRSSCSAAVLRLSSRSLRGPVIGSWHYRIVVAQRREELIPLAVRIAVGGLGPCTLHQIEDLFNSHEFTAGLGKAKAGLGAERAPTPPLGVEADAAGNA